MTAQPVTATPSWVRWAVALASGAGFVAYALANGPGESGGAPSGRLWHSSARVGSYDSGTYVSPLNGGRSAFVTDYKFSVVDHRGARLVRSDYDAGQQKTQVRITGPDGKSTLAKFVVDGHLNGIQLSPTSDRLLLGRWSENYLAKRHSVIYDYAAGKLLYATPAADANDGFAWLPDGKLVRVRANGSIGTLAVDGRETALGAVQWPAGWELGAVFASPDGQNLAVRLDRPAGKDHDLWVMKLDGQGLARFTTTQMSTYAVWSPDSRYLAFNKDTGASCSEASCYGSCKIWYAPVTSRNIVAVDASRDASPFIVKNTQGSSTPLGCQLLAWTP